MPVDLNPQLETTIREKVESGRYLDANEVVREALVLLEERDRHRQLRTAVQVGLDDIAAGRVRRLTLDRLEELRQMANEEDRHGSPISADVQPGANP